MNKKDNKVFSDCSYHSQVRRLRSLAVQALKTYTIGQYELRFVQHGENSTFKVLTKKQNYLLRIHRANYHSLASIKEELKWLAHLTNKTEINVQAPLKSKDGKLVTEQISSLVGPRYIDLLTWQNGYIKNKKTKENYYSVGSLLAQLQNNTIKSKHRNYWDAEGLLGNNATFGSLKLLNKEYPKAYKIIEPCRRETFKELKAYQRKKNAKIGLMHADLHFGNMIWNKEGVSPIDFDDCGVGLQMYDLAVNLHSTRNFYKKIGRKNAQEMKNSLLEGYNSHRSLTQNDIDIIPHLMRARDILMIAWLCERQDNPVLKEHLNKELMNKVKRIKSQKEYWV